MTDLDDTRWCPTCGAHDNLDCLTPSGRDHRDRPKRTKRANVNAPGGRDLLNTIVENKIRLERERQIELGYDQHHDDEHGIEHLVAQADEYRRNGKYIEALALWRAHDEALARRLVVIQRAALRQNSEGSQS